MIEDVVRLMLPAGEDFAVQKNSIIGEAGEGKRLCIVTGTHGDELEGQYVAFQLARLLEKKRNKLRGQVDIYPSLNPMGIRTIYRGLPGFDLDMNRIFPGSEKGSMYEYVAHRIVESISGADLAIDIHASNIFLRELPQIRINEKTANQLVPMSKVMNMDLVWVHSAATVLESTLAWSLNSTGTPCLVVEMGVGMRLTIEYGDKLVAGILATMVNMGMLLEKAPSVGQPIVSTDGHVGFVNANQSGIFMPVVPHGCRIHQGQTLGVIADSLTGKVREELKSPTTGLLFTLREYPVVLEGSLIARVLEV